MTKEYCFTECERILSIVESYVNGFEQIYDDIRHTVICTRYGIGGEYLDMGYYCPSPVADIIAGNANRGVVVKEPGRRKTSFEYGFDNENRLVCISCEHAKWIIMYLDAKILSVRVSNAGTFSISECIYDANARLESYTVYLSRGSEKEIQEFTREVYDYGDTFTTDWYRFSCYCAKRPILEHEKFIFSKDNGECSSYTVESYCEGKRRPSVWDGHVFKIPNKKRNPLIKTIGDFCLDDQPLTP